MASLQIIRMCWTEMSTPHLAENVKLIYASRYDLFSKYLS